MSEAACKKTNYHRLSANVTVLITFCVIEIPFFGGRLLSLNLLGTKSTTLLSTLSEMHPEHTGESS